ncbi:MAG: AAA family ATPase [Pseudomonadota bacterium]|nr:MAG: AAA family ATPase [Pseudomonadota bacterium]
MQRVLVINAKGGCGKTTIATNLACAWACSGYRAALLDYDPQASAMRWLSLRSDERPAIHGVAVYRRPAGGQTSTWLHRLPPGTERVVMDVPAGVTGTRLLEYTRRADVVLVPVLPSPIDIHAASRFIQDLLLEAKVRQTRVRVGVVANRTRENTRIFQALQRFLASLELPLVTQLRDTQNYVHAAERGIGIHEMWDSRAGRDKCQWVSLMDWLEQSSDSGHGDASRLTG